MSNAAAVLPRPDSPTPGSSDGPDGPQDGAADPWPSDLEAAAYAVEDQFPPEWLPSWQVASATKSQSSISNSDRALLRRGGFLLEPWRGDDPAVATGERERRLLRTAWDIERVSSLRDVDEDAVDVLLKERVLFAVDREGIPVFPEFQFTRFGLLPGAADVWPQVRRGLALVAVARWFTEASAHLVVAGERLSPREWLLEGGDPTMVGFLARSL